MREQAIQNLSEYKNIEVIAKGLWSCETELGFYSQDDGMCSSFVIGEASVVVPVTSLDKFFARMPESEWPTFIKMDIEGAEKEALLGAERIIRQKRPKLAISAYHKPEDIYELAQLIQKFNPNYRFSLQRYGRGIADMVLYAV